MQPMEGVLDELASAAALAEESPEALTALAADRGGELRALGINMVFAPVVDVGSAGGIGDRSFGDTSDVVTSKAGAYAAGLRSAGVLPVLKHFPGQGHADADTHEGPSTTPSLELLRSSDLVPYDAILAAGPNGVMVGHLDVPGLTEGGVPASLSPAAIGLLRAGYEFDGLVVTDDLVGDAGRAVAVRGGRGGRAGAGGGSRRAPALPADRRGAGPRSAGGGRRTSAASPTADSTPRWRASPGWAARPERQWASRMSTTNTSVSVAEMEPSGEPSG